MRKFKIDSDNKIRIWNWLQNNSIAHRGRFDGDKEKQLVGLVGESEFYKLLYGEYPEFKDGFDQGVDLVYKGKRIDVKTMGRNVVCTSSYVNNFLKCQLDYKCDIVVFISLNKKDNYFQVCGSLPKHLISQLGKFYPAGSTRYRDDNTSFVVQEDMYEVSCKDLMRFSELV